VSPQTALQLAQATLAVHIAIAGFVVFGIAAIPLGARLGWPFVYVFWWRLLHLGAMGIIALQKLLGNSCFLSVWEFHLVDLASRIPHPTPLFQTIGEHVLYWNLPLWFLAVLYTALFAFVGVMWFVVPPRLKGRAINVARST
jgi:hypothetical protein